MAEKWPPYNQQTPSVDQPNQSEEVNGSTTSPEAESYLDHSEFLVLGEINPSTLSREGFDTSPNILYHASKNQDFHVAGNFDYKDDQVDGATLGDGLYVTANKAQAENYARRRKGNVFELLPFQARMLDLTMEGREKNGSLPKALVEKWISFAEPKIDQKIAYWQDRPEGWVFSNELGRLKRSMSTLLQREKVDLRRDILGTDSEEYGALPGSLVNNTWIEFCQQEGIDGLIYVEGGEGEFGDQHDATHVFYSLDKIGTFEDWQSKKSEQENHSSETENSLQYFDNAHRNSQEYMRLIQEFSTEVSSEQEDQLSREFRELRDIVHSAQQEQEVRFTMQEMGVKGLLRQIVSTASPDRAAAQEQAIDELDESALEKVGPGMFVVWVKPEQYSSVIGRESNGQATAYKIKDGVSFVILQSGRGEKNEQENKQHELHHVVWDFLQRKDAIPNTEDDPYVARSYSVYQDEVIARLCSDGHVNGYNHMFLMSSEQRTQFREEHPNEAMLIESKTEELNQLLTNVEKLRRRTDVPAEDLIWPVAQASSFESLKASLQDVLHQLNQHPSLRPEESEKPNVSAEGFSGWGYT